MPTDTTPQRRAIFFDRDGVINRRLPDTYVKNWSEFELLPGIADVLREVKQRGYLAIIITNQRGVGLGLMTEADLDDIHENLQALMLREAGTRFDDIFTANDIDDSSGRRKPAPTMILEAAEKWNIDLSESWMIGDSPSDIEAGKRAGTKTAFAITDHTDAIPEATIMLHDIHEILNHL